MKNLVFILFLIFCGTTSVSANLRDWPSWAEEEACFDLLNKAVENDNRFTDATLLPDWDLSNVLYDEASSSYYDFSSYSNFWSAAVENPANSWWSSWDNYYFEARRNNIGTIISWNDYILSQVSWFWRDSNFDFPLESKTWTPFGDKYKFNGNFFKEYVIYTHHIKSSSEDYPLLSCGIVKVTPLGGRTFADINESGYMTNILNGISNQPNLWNNKCASWFEWEYKSKSWEDFYKMKANVCVQSYDESDYLKIEVISIAYDNDSKRLNEYYTHPLQVKTMRDNSNHADGLKWIQDVFREKLEDETCYSVIHWSRKSDLPSHCGNNFWPISYKYPQFSFFDYVLPSVYADRSAEQNLPELTPEEEADTGMMVYWNLPYKLYKKLENIPDEIFREYMLLSILPNFEELIQHRVENNALLTPFEEIFSACPLDYSQRLWVVTDFLEKLDIESFSVSELQYSNEIYGDCVIPYPDVDKLSIEVEGSFKSNQLLAQKINGSYTAGEDDQIINEYIQKRESLLADFNNSIADIESRFNKWEVDLEQANVLKAVEEEKYQWESDKNDIEFEKKLSDVSYEATSKEISNSNKEMNFRMIMLIWLLLFIGVWVVWFVIYRKHKK
jgi:hypothetical protein